MANLTIRNVPEDLHAWLRAKAEASGRSLNQLVIEELASLDGETGKERVERLIGFSREIGAKLERPLSLEEMRAGIEEGRR